MSLSKIAVTVGAAALGANALLRLRAKAATCGDYTNLVALDGAENSHLCDASFLVYGDWPKCKAQTSTSSETDLAATGFAAIKTACSPDCCIPQTLASGTVDTKYCKMAGRTTYDANAYVNIDTKVANATCASAVSTANLVKADITALLTACCPVKAEDPKNNGTDSSCC